MMGGNTSTTNWLYPWGKGLVNVSVRQLLNGRFAFFRKQRNGDYHRFMQRLIPGDFETAELAQQTLDEHAQSHGWKRAAEPTRAKPIASVSDSEIARYMGLIKHLAQHMPYDNLLFDDYVNAGMVGVVRALGVDRSANKALVVKCIKGEMFTCLKQFGIGSIRVSEHWFIRRKNQNTEDCSPVCSLSLQDSDELSETYYNPYIHTEISLLIEELMSQLTDEQYMLINSFFLEGYSYSEISSVLGVSPSRVGQMMRKSLDAARDVLSTQKGVTE
jgi:RNA polymerase sigma factor (sigma-70 family)